MTEPTDTRVDQSVDSPVDAARAALVWLVRDEGTRVLATLIRITGDVQLAEDCVQDATVRALETWPRDGVPDVPRAWIIAAARRRAVDIVRRESLRPGKEAAAMDEPPADDLDHHGFDQTDTFNQLPGAVRAPTSRHCSGCWA